MDRKPVVSLEDRVPQLRQRRRKRANRRMSAVVLVFVLIILVVLYFQSPYSKIQTIQVSGNDILTEQQILEAGGFAAGDSFWTTDEESIKENLQENELIKLAEVKKDFPTTMTINIEEFEQTAYLRQEQAYTPVYENGFLGTPGPSELIRGSAPLLVGFDDTSLVEKLAASLSELPDEVLNSISEIHHSPTDVDDERIQIFMNDGFEVSAIIPTFADKMVHYGSIVSQLDPNVKGVIDLEVGSYFRAYEQPEDTEQADETETSEEPEETEPQG
ncbi:cell division protein FtsQ/DivIB [Jeotgalibacillus sp. R-1-5s-1]|uniref:cell division protein FtsQ/DivIB n=1 Tax=Jeotgalibacillus sp. R-1-5s-1 TaxID=2555897 RepID=UPI00106C6B92|nr:FtsQ-type POTRA domain-containing protein [Jeotgalibacillus sp. R-1-5s-1]TFE03572.1 FtsQ-type POTRA domain-containing protein [Jeotgalibacillus sp. R-1-5s-1]